MDTYRFMMNALTNPLDPAQTRKTERFDIHGMAVPKVAGRLLLSLGLICSAYWLWKSTEWTEPGGYAWFFCLAFLVTAVLLPLSSYKYLDLRKRIVVKLKRYAFLEMSREETPFDEFSRVVVRHICHPGGEGEDTYTGSVGLKPQGKGPVMWIKDYPATSEEMPKEAVQFGKALEKLTGIPYKTL